MARRRRTEIELASVGACCLSLGAALLACSEVHTPSGSAMDASASSVDAGASTLDAARAPDGAITPCAWCSPGDECVAGYVCAVLRPTGRSACVPTCAGGATECADLGVECVAGDPSCAWRCITDASGVSACLPPAALPLACCVDRDRDGYGIGVMCGVQVDCDDADPRIGSTFAIDACDLVDNDCDGRIDEGFPPRSACPPACVSRDDGTFEATAEGTCTEGRCSVGAPTSCGLYRCGVVRDGMFPRPTDECARSCADDDLCIDGARCEGGVCVVTGAG